MHASLSALGRRVEALSRLVWWPESSLGFCAGGLRGQALARELLRAQREVEANLFVDLGASLIFAAHREVEEAPDAGPDVPGAGG